MLDAFSGSAVVAYMYKTKGLRVIANDRLHYCHHAARAIIENNSERLSEDEIEELLADNAKAGSFVQDNFKGIFFAKGVHAPDRPRSAPTATNSPAIKKDIALFAPGQDLHERQGRFRPFFVLDRLRSTPGHAPRNSKSGCARTLQRINALVFDNGKENKAHRRTSTTCCPRPRRIWPISIRPTPPSFPPPITSEPTTSWKG